MKMSAHLCCQVNSYEEADARRQLEHIKMDKGGRTFEDSRRKIPRLYRRSNHRTLSKQPAEYLNKKIPKKEIVKSSLLYDSLLNHEEQVRINENILELQNKWGLNISQKNGQRKLGGPPPGWNGPPPGPGCEIFVGRIPRNIYEDVIYPVFRAIGGIYEMRLMMNFSGTNRGFCFIMYENAELAQRAIKELNHYEIVPGWFIGVVESVNNCRLHVTDLPSQTNAEMLIQKIWPICEDINKVSVYTNISNPQIKHALISFNTHRSAAMARRRLLPERSKFFDKPEVRIEWAHPKISVTNVIEECGYYNENGKVEITKRIIGQAKIARKKKSSQINKSRNVDTLKNSQVEDNFYEESIPFKMDNYDRIVNNNNLEKYSVNQTVYNEDFYCSENNCKDCMNKYSDNLKYSMRSDESLSDFSKSSDFDDYRNTSYNPNEIIHNNILLINNPMNCSSIPYPWNIHNSNQQLNVQQRNIQFYNINYPWKIMKETINTPVQVQEHLGPYLLNHETLKCNMATHFNNHNFRGENTPVYHRELAANARPILNRGILTA